MSGIIAPARALAERTTATWAHTVSAPDVLARLDTLADVSDALGRRFSATATAARGVHDAERRAWCRCRYALGDRALALACAACGAKPLHPCRNLGTDHRRGTPNKTVHPERLLALCERVGYASTTAPVEHGALVTPPSTPTVLRKGEHRNDRHDRRRTRTARRRPEDHVRHERSRARAAARSAAPAKGW